MNRLLPPSWWGVVACMAALAAYAVPNLLRLLVAS